MYTHTGEAFPSEIAEANDDFLENPQTEKQFDSLKKAILQRIEKSDSTKLKELLNNVSMGDCISQMKTSEQHG